MKKIRINEEDFVLEDKDVALILTLQKLTSQIRRLANNGR